MADRNTTDVLAGDLDDEENIRWLYERFRDAALRIAGARIPEHLRAEYDTEAVAQTSLRQALLKAAGLRSEEFQRLLRRITKCRKQDALRRISKGGREDIVLTPDSSANVAGNDFDPQVAATINELVEQRIVHLQNTDDPVRNLISVYAVLLGLNAPACERILNEIPSIPKPIPSLPTIRRQIELANAQDQKFLEQWFADADID